MVNVAYVDVSYVDDEIYSKLYAMADAQRKARAQRYLRFEDKVRCAAAGALLRHVAKSCLGSDAFEIQTDIHGKPFIKDAPNLHFNLSHSGKWVVIAYGDTPVGIDVEKVDSNTAMAQIASRFFTPEEQIYALSSKERFFEIWTAKESYIKYLGKGLQMGLNSFSVLSVKDIRFCRIHIDPAYCMTLCAAQPPDTTLQLTLEQLIKL